jgi:transcriptional regulator with XRE-family HTH domain
METFGKRLKHLIKNSEYKKIKVFAEKAGLHAGSVSNIINGINNPSYDVIMACLSLFNGADVLWLLTGKRQEDNVNELKREIAILSSKLSKVEKL